MKSLFLTLLFFISGFEPAISQDSLLVVRLQENLYTLRMTPSGMEGTGLPLLEEAIADHPFLLVGEQHGIREVPDFTRWLFEMARPYGFRYLCIETDPFIARKVEHLAALDTAEAGNYFRKYPFGTPFYNEAENFQLLRRVRELTDSDPAFWGVDYVHMAAPRFLFSEMARIAPDEETRQLSLTYLERGQAGIRAFLETGNPAQSLLFQLQEADFGDLERRFSSEPTGEALHMLAGIRETQQIFGHWFEGRYYQNNLTRSFLMKRQFMAYYRPVRDAADGTLPKIVFKFGSNHVEQGRTATRIFDLGNLVSELAAAEGEASFHILMTGMRGTVFNALKGIIPFDESKDLPPSVVAAAGEALEGKDWLMIDFRPLRTHRYRNIEESLERWIYNFDVWILVPEAHHTTPINPLEAGR